MKQFKRILSLALSCILAAGLICTAAAAEGDIGVWVDAVVNPTGNDVSQGAVSEEGGQVFLTHTYGTVTTLTSAHLGGIVTIPDVDGEAVTLKTIVAEPGCVGYATTEDGLVYTEEDMDQDDDLAYSDLGMLFCHYYDVHRDGTIEDGGLSDNDLLGNAYSRFGLYEYPNNDIAMVLFTFFADDGQYWVTTQEALDKFAQLTGIKAVETVFSDVAPDAYYAQAVEWAVDNGVTNGTGNNAFSPNATVTRAEAVTFLWRAAGSPKPNTRTSPFTDVTDSGAWYYQAVLWAAEQGITNGVSATQFSLKTTLAYDQMLAFLCRAAGEDASGSDWDDKAVSWAKKNGLTNGISFSNKRNCPRSDVVYFLWKQLADKTTEEETSRPDLAGARAAITKSLLALDQEINLSAYNLSITEAEAMMKEMTLAGEVGMFVSNWSVSPVYQENGTSNAGRIWIAYPNYSPKEDLIKVKEKIKQITAEAVTPGMSEYEIAKALHDWLVLHNKYDMRYYSNTLTDSAYTPYAALITGTSVCNGYGEAYKAMARYNGLKCLYVSGYGHTGRHGWNLVNIDGQWYHVDVTWDDPTPDRAGYVRYNYFLKSDAYMSAHNHSKWQEESIFEWSSEYACTSTKYDGAALDDYDQTRQEEERQAEKQAEEIVAFCMEAMKDRPYPTEADLRAAENLDYEDCYFKINFPEGQFGEKLLGGALDKALVILRQKIPQSYPGCEADYIFRDYARIKRNDVEAELQRRDNARQERLMLIADQVVAFYLEALKDMPYSTQEELRAFEGLSSKDSYYTITVPNGMFAEEDLSAVNSMVKKKLSEEFTAHYPDLKLSSIKSSSVRIHRLDVESELKRRDDARQEELNRRTAELETTVQAGIQEFIKNGDVGVGSYKVLIPDGYSSSEISTVVTKMRASGYSFDGYRAGVDFNVAYSGTTNGISYIMVRNPKKEQWAEGILQGYIEQIHQAILNREPTVSLKWGTYPEETQEHYAIEAVIKVKSTGFCFDDGLVSGVDFTITDYCFNADITGTLVKLSYPETTEAE